MTRVKSLLRRSRAAIEAKYCMWALNTYFFFIMFTAIRTGEFLAMIPVAIAYIALLNLWHTINGIDNTT